MIDQILTRWNSKDYHVTITMEDRGTRQWPGTCVRVIRYDSKGKSIIVASSVADTPVLAIERAEQAALSFERAALTSYSTKQPSLFDDDEPA